jgi:Cu-Zn family superoxide dismutase
MKSVMFNFFFLLLLSLALFAFQSQFGPLQTKDSAITEAVKAKLAAEERLAKLTDIHVTTNEGTVSLTGNVKTQDAKRLAEHTTMSVDGVSKVVNNLQVLPNTAEAELLDNSGKSVGKATLREDSGAGVRIHLSLNGLPAGTHGIHVHEIGECKEPDFKSAGKHFNPEGKHHGAHNPNGFHAGDLGNVQIGKDGSAEVDVQGRLLTLGPGENSLLRPDGTSIVIHAKSDDEKSDPSGNSGEPIACGVVKSEASVRPVVNTLK